MLTVEIVLTALLFIGFGVAISFFGYQLFRIFLFCIGFILAAVLANNWLVINDPTTKILVILVLGLIGALLANLLHSISFAISTGILVGTIAATILDNMNTGLNNTAELGIVIFVGLLAAALIYIFNLKRIAIILATGAYGGYLVARGILEIITAGQAPDLTRISPLVGIIVLAAAIFIAATGIAYQFKESEKDE
jgi:hypothetical protein